MNRIEDYALIGDGETAALVGIDGSIDWLCWPRFDSPACFAALLGDADNGRWRISPCDDEILVQRRYLPDTLILETEYQTATGCAVVIDFMPVRGDRSDLVRMVMGKNGTVDFETELILRFGYGATVPWVMRLDDGRLRAVAGPDMVVLSTNAEVHGKNLTTVGEFTVHAGETASFVLTWSPSHLEPASPVSPKSALHATRKYWEKWMKRCDYKGDYPEAVKRSLITLKALIYNPTGAIVAAPTTSLPERIGGPRNWDYRYCWLRDATITLLALMNAGYYKEAAAWRDWLLRAAAGSPDQVQIMYGLSGERYLREWELPWLRGYENSRPVRVGNAAHEQLQLDVYGEVLDALHQARIGGIPASEEAWHLEQALVAQLEKIWQQPDQGIWETRGKPQHFTHSKVMAWVAMDRAVKSVEQFGLPGPVAHWRKLRDRIHAEVCEQAFDRERNSFVQSYGSRLLDAGALVIPIVGFLPIDDPRVQGTIAAIEKDLLVDGFVLRYDTAATDDGLPEGEGAFLACSFWLADNYALSGRYDDARKLFERLLTMQNDVGLLSEEYDPQLKRQVGNFPQAFSHVALLSTAANLGARPAASRPAHAETGANLPNLRGVA
jgi:GH15 family glucan-1,4-alpha-glucosidase